MYKRQSLRWLSFFFDGNPETLKCLLYVRQIVKFHLTFKGYVITGEERKFFGLEHLFLGDKVVKMHKAHTELNILIRSKVVSETLYCWWNYIWRVNSSYYCSMCVSTGLDVISPS